jgi:FtsH-binding integral membrane protein
MSEVTEIDTPGTDVVVSDGDGGALVAAEGHGEVEVAHASHPSARQYVMIAVVLVVITAFEIALSYLDTRHTNFIIWALFAMAAVKFFLVAAWYMHMKTDLPFFWRIFVIGMIGAFIIYGIVLLVFSSTVLKT